MKTIVIILTIVACAAIEEEKLYTTVIYMAQHPIGRDELNICGQDELLNYLREAFGFDENTHEKALEAAGNMKAPKMYLAVEVVGAEDLFPKDSNGQNDPFCVIYLNSTKEQRYKTKVQNKTRAPVWQEHFVLEFERVEDDTLHLEVWDFDPVETRSEKWSQRDEAQGVKRTMKFLREMAAAERSLYPTAELIGSIEIPLKDISVIGEAKSLILRKKGRSNPRGTIKLRLAFVSGHNSQDVVEEYRELLKILLSHAIETEEIEDYCWSGISSPAARAIELRHRAQRGLLQRNVALSQWIEYSRINKRHPLHFSVFKKLARKLLRSSADRTWSSAESELFWEGARKVLYTCFKFVKDIERLRKCNATDSAQLDGILGIISSISGMKVPEKFDLFPIAMYDWLPIMPETKMTVSQVFKSTVEEGIAEWWDRLPAEKVAESNADRAAIEYRIDVTRLVLKEMRHAFDIVDKVFIRYVDFLYPETVFVTHANRLSDLCKETVESVCLKLKPLDEDNRHNEVVLGQTLYTLYKQLKSFVEYNGKLGISGVANMPILSYHEWFTDGVYYWLDMSRVIALERIINATNLDDLTSPVTADSKYSSSAVDALAIFLQTLTFWRESAWPDAPDSLMFLEIIIKHGCTAFNVYADELLAKVENAVQQPLDTLDDDSSESDEEIFQVSPAWCFAISDIEHVRMEIGASVNKSVPHMLLAELGPQADYFLQSVNSLINDATNDLEEKIARSFEIVGTKIVKAINKYIIEIAESSEHYMNLDAMLRLENYLTDNVTLLREKLSADNLSKIAATIWPMLLQRIYRQTHRNLKKNKPTSFYSYRHNTIRDLSRGFYELGVEENSANVEMLEKIERLLKFNAMETTELICLYNIDRIRYQENLKETIDGTLMVVTQFIGNVLNVEILGARNLVAMDSDGFSDPYVKVRLLPDEWFHRIKMPRTSVHKSTLSPSFQQTFNISLSSEQRNLKDAILVFEVWDQDLCAFNRFMAEAFVPFSEIPEHDIEKAKPLDLKLSRPSSETTIVVETLKNRKADKLAKRFIAKRQARIKLGQSAREPCSTVGEEKNFLETVKCIDKINDTSTFANNLSFDLQLS